MKKPIVIFFILWIAGLHNLQAQERKTKVSLLPDTIIGAYKAKYKKIEVDQWYEDDGNYKALFRKGPAKYKATFNVDGKWLSTSTEIDKDKMNGGIKKYLKGSEFKDWKVARCEKVETPVVPKMYVVKLKKKKEEQVLNFDEKGKIRNPETK